jgi:hypothetical protein
MANPAFNDENIAEKIQDIKDMSESDKEREVDSIKGDLKSYVRDNFSLTTDQDNSLENIIDPMWEEMGIAIAIALENEWNIEIVHDEELDSGNIKDEVGVTYDPVTGDTIAYKKVSWNWWC